MKPVHVFSLSLLFLFLGLFGQYESKVWQKVEIVLEASLEYDNPYKDVEVWIQLKGPDFDKRCYGFWDGDNTWRIRVMATSAGEWTWTGASN